MFCYEQLGFIGCKQTVDGSIHSIIWKDILWHQKSDERFFTPIPHTYISSPLHGAARNLLFLATWIPKITQFYHVLIHFSYLLVPEKKSHLV